MEREGLAVDDQPAPQAAHSRFGGKPYLQHLESIENAFPALKSFLEKLANHKDYGRKVVRMHYNQRKPERCYCLKFEETSVSAVEEDGFEGPAALKEYLEQNPARESLEEKK